MKKKVFLPVLICILLLGGFIPDAYKEPQGRIIIEEK